MTQTSILAPESPMSRPAIRRSFAVAAFVMIAAPGVARAQQSPIERVYVSGALVTEIKRFSGDPGEAILDGESVGAGLTIGTALNSRWDLQFGIDVPSTSSTSRDRLVTLQKTTFTLQSVTSNQTLSVSTLARFRGARIGRVQLGYLGGISFVRLRKEAHTAAPDGTPGGLIPRPDTSIEYSAAPTVGLDARIPLTHHLSLIPGLHATVFKVSADSGALLRPRVGIRWGF